MREPGNGPAEPLNPGYTTQIMAMPEPKVRPYQFSSAVAVLFTLFVALLCSIRVSTGRGYVAAVVVVNVLISGFAGRTVAGNRIGHGARMRVGMPMCGHIGLHLCVRLGRYLWNAVPRPAPLGVRDRHKRRSNRRIRWPAVP